ncbi:hypothetical protein [Streptomyces caelestis]|uniref:hypothetical protein n=1 Tax=Streptomyces caelestis TaxID=36816 RepID=UPI0036D3A25B
MSGLGAAHTLAERGYAVTVHEHYDALGDKAHSTNAPGTGAGGRTPLPGEHGCRFLPGFSRNLPDAMRGIPFAGKADGVRGNLRSGTEALFARGSGRPDLPFLLRRHRRARPGSTPGRRCAHSAWSSSSARISVRSSETATGGPACASSPATAPGSARSPSATTSARCPANAPASSGAGPCTHRPRSGTVASTVSGGTGQARHPARQDGPGRPQHGPAPPGTPGGPLPPKGGGPQARMPDVRGRAPRPTPGNPTGPG